MKIFYSYSSFRTTSYDAYKYVSENLDNEIMDIQNSTKNSLNDKIFESIKNASFFVADVTPDSKEDSAMFPNPNVLIELGYALNSPNLCNDNIFLLCDESVCRLNNLPSMLQGYYFETYNNLDSDYKEFILDKIKEKYTKILENYNSNEKLKILLESCDKKYYPITITQKFVNALIPYLGIRCDFEPQVCLSIKNKRGYLIIKLSNSENIRYIDVSDRLIYIKKKKNYHQTCLSTNNDLNDELKHLEIKIMNGFYSS